MKHFDKIFILIIIILIIIYAIIFKYKHIVPIDRKLFQNTPKSIIIKYDNKKNEYQIDNEENNEEDKIQIKSYTDKIYSFVGNYIAYIIGILLMVIYIQKINKEYRNNILVKLILLIILFIFIVIIEYSYVYKNQNQITYIASAISPFSQTILLIFIGLLIPILNDEKLIEKIRKINIYK